MNKLSVKRLEDVNDARKHYLDTVDIEAEKARYVSPAKEAVYQRKLAEAKGEAPLHLLNQEAKALGVEVSKIRERVLKARNDWENRAFEIEIKRIKAKQIIRESEEATEMYQAVCDCSFLGN